MRVGTADFAVSVVCRVAVERCILGGASLKSRSLTELPIGPDLAGFVARVAARPFLHKVDSMATPCCNCDHTCVAPADLYGPVPKRGGPLASIVVRSLAPLVAACALGGPIEHAAGLSGRGSVVLLCVAGVVRLARRLRRARFRWDPAATGAGHRRQGTW